MNVRKKPKPGDAVGRPSWGSSLLSDRGAKFFCGKRRSGTKQEKTGAGLSSGAGVRAVAVGCVAWQERSSGMSRTHRAERRKSSACQSATQIVFRSAVVAGKIWTSQTENSFHLDCRYVHGQQFSSQPQIDDAPVRLRKALPNTPTFRPALIMRAAPWAVIVVDGLPTRGRQYVVSRTAADCCAISCVAKCSNSGAARAMAARASTIFTQGA